MRRSLRQLTVYEAAMVYAGRHPYPYFFSVKGGSIRDYEGFLKLGLSEASARRRRAQLSWDVCCQLMDRIKKGIINPIRIAYQPSGEIDFRRTRIETRDLLRLASDRRENPRYLRHLQTDIAVNEQATKKGAQSPISATRKRGRKPLKFYQTTEAMRSAVQERRLTVGALADKTEAALSKEYGVSRDTARRARNSVLAEQTPVEK